LYNEIRDHASIVRVHYGQIQFSNPAGLLKEVAPTSRTIGVEDTSHSDVYTILALKSISQRLCNSLPFIIARSDTDWVNMTPAVDFGVRRRSNKGCMIERTSLLAADELLDLRRLLSNE